MSSSFIPSSLPASPATPIRASRTILKRMGRDQHIAHMARDVGHSFLGPMPPGEFLSEFFPSRSVLSVSEKEVSKGVLAALKGKRRENTMYEPFVSLDRCVT
jgi:hypothetical protein